MKRSKSTVSSKKLLLPDDSSNNKGVKRSISPNKLSAICAAILQYEKEFNK